MRHWKTREKFTMNHPWRRWL